MTPEEIVGMIGNIANRADIREVQERQIKEIKKLIMDGPCAGCVPDDVCCCGDSMEGHPSPFDSGHSPVSMRDHYLSKV